MTKHPKPPPDNLGKRQYDLNKRVNDAYATKITFDAVQDEKENSEVDKFFKIDLAAKCRNIEYIMDIFKAGESLHAHRALKKCKWLFNNEYADVINPTYLEENIFPVTSMRVKKMILKTVVMNLRDENRAKAFFEYCMSIKMIDVALKCLLFTSEEYKLHFLQNADNGSVRNIIDKKHTYIRFLIGESFALLDAYMKMLSVGTADNTIRKFRYLYPADNNKYLDLLEKYLEPKESYFQIVKFEGKLCDDIMKKHKHRVLAKPLIYMNCMHEKIVARNVTADEAKLIITGVLPPSAQQFRETWFSQDQAEHFLPLLPQNEVIGFLKSIFQDKYPGEEFETHIFFYEQSYYDLMTTEQREEWALNQLKSDRQALGVGNDYLWYRFLKFEVAFGEIKKLVAVTKEAEKRGDMLRTLVRSIRSDRDLERLFKYYYKRHVNEPKVQTVYFIDSTILYQNVLEFDNACWEAFYPLLLSVEMYTCKEYSHPNLTPGRLDYFRTATLFYHILNKEEMPEELIAYCINDLFPYHEYTYLMEKLNDEKRQFLINQLYTFYIDKINAYKNQDHTEDGASKLERYFSIIVKLLQLFNIHKEKKVPEKQGRRRKNRVKDTSLSDRQLLRELKMDKNLMFGKIHELKIRLESNRPIVVNNFLNKIKIYFPDDVAEEFLNMFEEVVSEKLEKLGILSVESCVNGIFKLGDADAKVNFMKKYTPESTKIDFNEIKMHQLNIHKAICQNASKSLPPVPLTQMLTYMQGDYSRYCLHLFGVYISALPMKNCIDLVEALLDTSVSIQKHALRLAFQCFSTDRLINISEKIWKKTFNVSLRSVIYQALYKRLEDKKEMVLCDTLISLTLDVHDDDEDIIFDLLVKDTLPREFLGKYKKATWQATSAFKDKEPNIGRKSNIICGIRKHFNIMNKEYVRTIIDEHLNTMFVDSKHHLTYSEDDIAKLYKEKWNLVAEYIFSGSSVVGVDTDNYIKLAQHVVVKCVEKWQETHSGKHIYQRCCWEFIDNLNNVSIEHKKHSESLIPIYEGILSKIQEILPFHDTYMKKWQIQLVLASKRVMKIHREHFEEDDKAKVIRRVTADFSREVGKLITEYVKNNVYFRSFLVNINDVITVRVDEILNVIASPTDEKYNEYRNGALTTLAAGLVEFDTVETYTLALRLLPTDCEECVSDQYKLVVDNALKFPHSEVQCAVHQKLQQS